MEHERSSKRFVASTLGQKMTRRFNSYAFWSKAVLRADVLEKVKAVVEHMKQNAEQFADIIALPHHTSSRSTCNNSRGHSPQSGSVVMRE